MKDVLKGILLGLAVLLAGAVTVFSGKAPTPTTRSDPAPHGSASPKRAFRPRPLPLPPDEFDRREELASYLSFWRIARVRGPGRLGSPYLFSLCRLLSAFLLLKEPPDPIRPRLASLVPVPPETPPEKIEKKNALEDEEIEETPMIGFGPSDAERRKFHDKILGLKIRWGKGRGKPPAEARIREITRLFGPRFRSLSKKEEERLLSETGSPPDSLLVLEAVLDLSDQWLFTAGAQGGFSDVTLQLPFKALDPKKGGTEKKIPFITGEVTIPFLENEGLQAFRLDLTHSLDVFFLAVMPEDLEEARKGWPRLLGKGEVWKVIDALTSEKPEWENLDLSFPKFEMKSVMAADLSVWAPGKEKASSAPSIAFPVRIKNESKVKVDDKGIAFHSRMCWVCRGSRPNYKEVVFDRPFLFLLYHRRMKSLLMLGEFLGSKEKAGKKGSSAESVGREKPSTQEASLKPGTAGSVPAGARPASSLRRAAPSRGGCGAARRRYTAGLPTPGPSWKADRP